VTSPAIILTVFFILFISTFARSTLGFGDALIAMPLLTLVVGVKIATPLVAFMGTTIAATILWKNWRNVDVKAAWRLILSSLIGIPFGLLLLTVAPGDMVKIILGVVLILFGAYNLLRPQLAMLQNQHWAYVFGFVAGILGGAYNTNGPPVVVYGTLCRWPPVHFRATLQGYFLPTGFLILGGHALGGLWTRQVWQMYIFALPLIFAAIFFGGKLNQRIQPERFIQLLYAILIVLGLLLIV
jgi:uncharacterized membrane protein YfcA